VLPCWRSERVGGRGIEDVEGWKDEYEDYRSEETLHYKLPVPISIGVAKMSARKLFFGGRERVHCREALKLLHGHGSVILHLAGVDSAG
jgi:hypothetical protein